MRIIISYIPEASRRKNMWSVLLEKIIPTFPFKIQSRVSLSHASCNFTCVLQSFYHCGYVIIWSQFSSVTLSLGLDITRFAQICCIPRYSLYQGGPI
jgi:hypothetical protein